MPYPISPFEEGVNNNMLLNSVAVPEKERIQNYERIQETSKWLCIPPKLSSYRVNILSYTTEEVKEHLENKIAQISKSRNIPAPTVEVCKCLSEVIIVHNWDSSKLNLEKKDNEIIVDVHCGTAVLRGAHVYAPGVIGMLSGTKVNDEVSIYADLSGKCKKGLNKLYSCDQKAFLGNGICKMARYHLFGENLTPEGIAIQVTDTISGCLPLGDDLLPKGSLLLQNIPSVVCVHALNPLPYDSVLDMCASPGNKTTHIAALMQNKGTLIAIDKTLPKIQRLKQNCQTFGANALIFQADSTQIVDEKLHCPYRSISEGPPFNSESFNKILLDAPCSALGKRPQLTCTIKEKSLKSYIPLQKKLFEAAVKLLKPKGCLVYSTCTITVAENEEIVAWALQKFDCLQLMKPEIHLGGPGLYASELNEQQRAMLQRFGPNDNVDSVGFFIACFIKICPIN